jgi:hypothetical protein
VRDDLIMATGRSDYPNQVNNVLGFPFIFRGALDAKASTINIDTKRTEIVIKTTSKCYGIAYHKGTLLWCEGSRGLNKMELSDGRIITSVLSSIKVTSREKCGEHVIFLSNVPSLFRIVSFSLGLLSVNKD